MLDTSFDQTRITLLFARENQQAYKQTDIITQHKINFKNVKLLHSMGNSGFCSSKQFVEN